MDLEKNIAEMMNKLDKLYIEAKKLTKKKYDIAELYTKIQDEITNLTKNLAKHEDSIASDSISVNIKIRSPEKTIFRCLYDNIYMCINELPLESPKSPSRTATIYRLTIEKDYDNKPLILIDIGELTRVKLTEFISIYLFLSLVYNEIFFDELIKVLNEITNNINTRHEKVAKTVNTLQRMLTLMKIIK